jgi:hypothetical protein
MVLLPLVLIPYRLVYGVTNLRGAAGLVLMLESTPVRFELELNKFPMYLPIGGVYFMTDCV